MLPFKTKLINKIQKYLNITQKHVCILRNIVIYIYIYFFINLLKPIQVQSCQNLLFYHHSRGKLSSNDSKFLLIHTKKE